MKFSYIIIPLLVAITAYYRSKFIKKGAGTGKHLSKPKWSPSRQMIKEVWIFLYLLIAVSLMLFWGVTQLGVWHFVLAAVLLVNAYFNIQWCKSFFVEQKLAKAYKQMIYINITTVVAIIIMWPIYLLPALLLVPYLVWTAIVARLTKEIWQLNKN